MNQNINSYHILQGLQLCRYSHSKIYHIHDVQGYFYVLEVRNYRFILCDECGKELEEIKVVEKNI